MYEHLMIDLETWGLRRGYAGRSIGAIPFDPVRGHVSGHGFYQNIDWPSQEKIGLLKNDETVAWWDKPEHDAARAYLELDCVTIYAAVQFFDRWLRQTFGEELPGVRLWSRGSMDVELLEGLYAAIGKEWPFHYRAPRDSRVILDLVEHNINFHMNAPSFVGTPHYAMDDARHECLLVSLAYKCLDIGGGVVPDTFQTLPNLSDRFTWAAPGDRQEDAWMIKFCDNDLRDCIWTGPGAETEAWAAWNRHSPGYNCYVFRLARLKPVDEVDYSGYVEDFPDQDRLGTDDGVGASPDYRPKETQNGRFVPSLVDNTADPVGFIACDGRADWGFWDETWDGWHGGYSDEASARVGLAKYVETL